MQTNLQGIPLKGSEIDRYSRHMLLPGVGLQGQLDLKKARVLVVGAGGIGSGVLPHLAASGIGVIGIVDDDKVEITNLHRQTLHGENKVGLSKALSAKIALELLNSHIHVEIFAHRLIASNAQALVRDWDLVLDGSDNASTRYILNDACVLEKKVLISGAAVKWEGQVTVLNFEDGPCYRCIFPECPKASQVPSCASAGVVGMVPGIVGQTMALEAFKFLTRSGDLLYKRMLIFDGLSASFKVAKLRGRLATCQVCSIHPTITSCASYDYDALIGGCIIQPEEHNPVDWREVLEGLNEKVLVDCRPHDQFAIIHFTHPQIIHLPLDELTTLGPQDLESRFKLGTKMQPLYVFCRSGLTSRTAVLHLLANGLSGARNITGGLQAYQQQVDSEVPSLK